MTRTLTPVTFSTDAQLLLDTAKGALPDVERAIIAPGPELAITCRMLAVHPETTDPKRQGGASGPTDFPGACAYFPVMTWRVIYAEDCYPTIDPERAKLPDASAVTGWSKTYVDRCETLWNALLDLSLGRQCEGMSVEAGSFLGPRSGVAWFSTPVVLGP